MTTIHLLWIVNNLLLFYFEMTHQLYCRRFCLFLCPVFWTFARLTSCLSPNPLSFCIVWVLNRGLWHSLYRFACFVECLLACDPCFIHQNYSLFTVSAVWSLLLSQPLGSSHWRRLFQSSVTRLYWWPLLWDAQPDPGDPRPSSPSLTWEESRRGSQATDFEMRDNMPRASDRVLEQSADWNGKYRRERHFQQRP